MGMIHLNNCGMLFATEWAETVHISAGVHTANITRSNLSRIWNVFHSHSESLL